MAQLGHRGAHLERAPRGRATGIALFAGALLVIVGAFHVIVAVAALLQSSMYSVDGGYLFGYDLSAWGWAHVGLAVLVAATGAALLAGRAWARVAGIVAIGLSAVGNFLFIPFQPLWAMLIIAVDVAVLWALAAPENRTDQS